MCVHASKLLCVFVFLRHELDQLWSRVQTLEEERTKPAQVELSSLPLTKPENHEDTGGTEKHEEAKEELGDEVWGADLKKTSKNSLQKDREKAARIIQTNWREHRNRVSNTQCTSNIFSYDRYST